MQEIALSDRTDFALGKESRRRDRTKPLLHHSDIVMRLTEEPLSASATAEQQSSEWRNSVRRSIRSQKYV